MKDNFILYTKYEEQISLLSDAQAGVLLRALMCYQSEKTLPQMDGMTNMIFTVIRQQIDFDNQKYDDICEIRRNAGAQGGRPSKSLTNKGNKPKKPNGFESEEEKPNGFEKKQTKAKKPESESDTDTDNITPIIPYEGKGEDLRAKFFKTYPSFRGEKRCDDSSIDYGVLLAEFEKSRVLRGMYSFAKVCGMYEAIVRGDFRDKDMADKPKDERTEAADARADRERWYADRKAKAEKKAEAVQNRFMQNEEFAKIEKRLKALPFEQAKAEVNRDTKTLVKLEQEKNRLTLQRRGIIELNGMSEEDLLPQWHCRKCKDTGYMSNGKMCDCYAKEK